MTRGEIQSFVDGFIKAGGNPEALKDEVLDWLDTHPLYKVSKSDQAVISSDLDSYRGMPTTLQPVDEELPI